MQQKLPRPTVFAHRGSSLYAPENTLAAFELAISQNADAIELDAKCSADGQVIIIHDQTVDRTTNGTGNVLELPLAELKELDAGGWFNERFQGEPIPTLGEVFEAVGQSTFINIELTNYASPLDDLPDKAVGLVKQHGLENNVLFSSFNPIALRRAYKLLPVAMYGLLALPGFWGAWARTWLGNLVPHQALHSEMSDTNLRLIQKQHKRGFRVHVWTVNSPERIQQFSEWNVDGIFTDDPLLARKILKRTER